MSQSKGTNKLILLIVTGMILVLLSIAAVFWLLFGQSQSDDSVSGQPVTFPVGENISDVAYNPETDDLPQIPSQTPVDTEDNSEVEIVPQSDWKDEIVEYTTPETFPGANEEVKEVSVSQNYDIDIEDYFYIPRQPTFTSKTKLVRTVPLIPFDSSPSPENLPELEVSSFKSCGSINIPLSLSGIENLISNLGTDDSAVCIGEAIADDCYGARVKITGLASGYLYVAERNDGICGIGSTFEYDNEAVTLCSVEKIMNESTNESKSFSEWKEMFEDDPGETFSDAYKSALTNTATNVNWTSSDCQSFKF